jgi:hypothetical protein
MDGNYPTDYAVVTSPHPSGWTYAARYTVGPESSVSGQPGQRTLDTLWATDPGTCWPGPCADGPSTWSLGKSRGYQGSMMWYRDQLYLPSNFQPLANSDWNTVFELHNYPDNNSAGNGVADANVICDITTTTGAYGPWDDGATSGARYSCRVAGGGSPSSPIDSYSSSTWPNNPAVKWAYFVGLNPVPLGQWIDSVWYVKWSWQQDSKDGCTDSTSVTGCMEWWVNGTKVASWSGPTLYYYANDGWSHAGPGQAYLQHGYYRNSSGTTTAGNAASSTASTTQVYHGGTMDGLTAAAIGEKRLHRR